MGKLKVSFFFRFEQGFFQIFSVACSKHLRAFIYSLAGLHTLEPVCRMLTQHCV